MNEQKKIIITYNSITQITANKRNTISKVSIDNLMQNRTAKGYNGYLSQRSKTQIKRCVSNFFEAIKDASSYKTSKEFAKDREVIFLTLTLPCDQEHSDNEIKRKCLNNFVMTMRRKYNIKNYLWVAEKQKNGNIHFHLCIDRTVGFSIINPTGKVIAKNLKDLEKAYDALRKEGVKIDYQIFSKKLNTVVFCEKSYQKAKEAIKDNKDYKIKRKLYIDGYRIINEIEMDWNNSLNSLKYIDKYEEKWKNRYPTTTKIEKPRTIGGVSMYVTKYITKNDKKHQEENGSKIEGRLWGMSDTLKTYEKVVAKHYAIVESGGMDEIYKNATFEYETSWFIYWAVELRKLKTIYEDCKKIFIGKVIQNYYFETQSG